MNTDSADGASTSKARIGAASIRQALAGTKAAQVAYGCAVTGRLGVERWALSRRRLEWAPVARRGRILAYHSIGTPAWGVNDVRPRDFERHLQLAADDSWTFATPAEVMAEPEKQQLAITFDDGVTSVLENAAPVLRHHGIPATMFVVSGWADGKHPDQYQHVLDWKGVSALQEYGISLASHSATHPDFGRLGAAEAREELEVSRQRMEQMLGLTVEEFAIPFGQSRNWTDAARIAAEGAGYKVVYAQAVETRPAGTVPRTFITRIDIPRLFRAALAGSYDRWEEWY
ncbi:polysaccharide deacetylase family protein [Pseudonocardia yunnanensis]|uniref:Polysaccharide deacetylase family protein n=1 Tax=Pseudonocardia yunnanensis TaxID=58107 RepID=A0ABW4F9A2_9PSEU